MLQIKPRVRMCLTMRIVFMGAPHFAVPALEALISSEHPVVAVYTQPDRPAGRGRVTSTAPVKQVALEHGLQVRAVQGFKEAENIESLAQLNPDLIVVAAFGLILPRAVLELPPLGCINLHPSLLPRHRGPTPIASAILAGDGHTGVSIMLLDEGVDSGPILAQQPVPIAPDETTASLSARLANEAARLLMETLPRWIAGDISPQPQQHEGATYTRMLSKADGEIDWQLPAEEIWRRVRAFNPWPSSYTRWHGKVLKIVEAAPTATVRGQPGAVTLTAKGQVAVMAGEGGLRLIKVQLEGKRQMAAEDFLRGQRSFIGSRLPS